MKQVTLYQLVSGNTKKTPQKTSSKTSHKTPSKTPQKTPFKTPQKTPSKERVSPKYSLVKSPTKTKTPSGDKDGSPRYSLAKKSTPKSPKKYVQPPIVQRSVFDAISKISCLFLHEEEYRKEIAYAKKDIDIIFSCSGIRLF